VGLPALFLKKIKKAPILFWILDLWPESLSATGAVQSRKVLTQLDKLVQYIYQGCDKIVVASKGFLPSVIAKGIAVERTAFFPNWYEPEYSAQSSSNEKTRIPDLPTGFHVMFAGNIGVAQDFGTILSAAEMLKSYPDIFWIILGDGRQYEWVKEQVKIKGLTGKILMMGRHAPEAMSAFFSLADTMLVTLKRDPAFALTVPGKIQSYMACGKPIVAALDGEGGRLIKESGTGLSSPAEEPAALAESILTLYRMPKTEREAMGLRGKAYCEKNFGRDMLLDRLDGWMRELI
jgi:glycosyltransferase involved in cell wall biosynthesis